MTTVHVSTRSGDYPISIGAGLLGTLHEAIPQDASSIVLLSNPTVMKHCGEAALAALAQCGKPLHQYSIPDGESCKHLGTLQDVWHFMLSKRLDRRAVAVALGGGVVGDLCGFAAAAYMRGIRFVQVPTTLLAQVDSSVGGKTGVNHELGKNMIGAFHQPVSVIIDINVLQTLPRREISAGLAEVLKYGLIMDEAFFRWFEHHTAELMQLDPPSISYAIERSCQCKAEVVSNDEKESGQRALLNFGHTFGHAIEAGLGYGVWLHGEAVGCGMVQAARLSEQALGLPAADADRIRAAVQAIGCPADAPNLGTEHWLALMQHDKKVIDQHINFVLLERLGKAVTTRVPDDMLRAVLEATATAQVPAAAASAGIGGKS